MPAVLLWSWQLRHLLSKIGCTALFQPTLMILLMPLIVAFASPVGDTRFALPRSAIVPTRWARGTLPITGVGPIAAACVMPGLMIVDSARSSWQPPHTRDSFARP